jgi:hypothetical protein
MKKSRCKDTGFLITNQTIFIQNASKVCFITYF